MAESHAAPAAEPKRSLPALKATRQPAGSGVDPAEWARLQGIQQRIEALIGGYTHGASRRPSFLRHFDRDRAPPVQLANAAPSGESTVELAEQEAARDRKAFLNL